MKQTAVEWLYDQIENKGKSIYEILDQAKSMEKEQIKDAYNDDRPNLTIYESNEAFKQYYNETFKSE